MEMYCVKKCLAIDLSCSFTKVKEKKHTEEEEPNNHDYVDRDKGPWVLQFVVVEHLYVRSPNETKCRYIWRYDLQHCWIKQDCWVELGNTARR